MRLVGASNMFVRAPFIIEGVVLGFIALAITAGIVFLLTTGLESKLLPVFDGTSPGLKDFFVSHVWELVGYEGLILSALVILSSWAAVGKYLKK
jgi:cell division transport system permease protein